jgi:hypothetical protein
MTYTLFGTDIVLQLSLIHLLQDDVVSKAQNGHRKVVQNGHRKVMYQHTLTKRFIGKYNRERELTTV